MEASASCLESLVISVPLDRQVKAMVGTKLTEFFSNEVPRIACSLLASITRLVVLQLMEVVSSYHPSVFDEFQFCISLVIETLVHCRCIAAIALVSLHLHCIRRVVLRLFLHQGKFRP